MRWITTLVAVALIVSATACGGSPTSPSATGTFNLRITDGPYSDAKALLVTFKEVTAHVDGVGGSNKVNFADSTAGITRTCDLKKLENNKTDILGVTQLPAGHYTMVRLVVDKARLYFDAATPDGFTCVTGEMPPWDGKDYKDVQIPSGEVKLNREFTVPDGGVTTMLIDFDGDRSVTQMGNGEYRMTPVIAVKEVQ